MENGVDPWSEDVVPLLPEFAIRVPTVDEMRRIKEQYDFTVTLPEPVDPSES